MADDTTGMPADFVDGALCGFAADCADCADCEDGGAGCGTGAGVAYWAGVCVAVGSVDGAGC